MKTRAALLAERLNPVERRIVIMRYADELSFAEIAAVLEVDEGWVRTIHDRVVDEARRPRAAK